MGYLIPAGGEPFANFRTGRWGHGRKIWPGLVVVLLLALACSTSATQVVFPTVISIPTETPPTETPANTVAPTPTIQPTIQPITATPAVQPSWPAPITPDEPVITPVVTVGEATFSVELADTPEKRTRGLSGRPGLDASTGMLFVFDAEDRSVFWMREMQFPLDFVWIGSNCSVADISENVPEPSPGMDLSDLPRYQPSVPVRYVLEINAGEIAAAGITRGNPVGFKGSITGLYGC